MKKKDIIFILISGFFLVVAWIGFSIYHNAKTSTIPEATNIQIAPIIPTFDMETIADIKKRNKIQAIFEEKIIPTQTATNTASPARLPITTPSPIASEAAKQNQAAP